MNLEFFYWREPLWLFIILVPPVILLIIKTQQKSRWKSFVDPHLVDWVQSSHQSSSQNLIKGLLFITWIFLCISLAGPRTVQWAPPSLLSNENTDKTTIIAIVDFSSSMRAQDQLISRLSKAQNLLNSYLSEMPKNLSLGIIIYAGHSYTYIPPTEDKKILTYYNHQLNSLKPPTLGNNLSSALIEASKWLKKDIKKNKQHLLLLSDGDLGSDSQSQAEKTIVKLQHKYDFKITIIGLGGAEAVVVPNYLNNPLIIKGKTIVSRRQGAWLQEFAKKSSGLYQAQEGIHPQGLDNLTALLELDQFKIKPEYNDQVLWDEWFFIPLLSAIVLLFIVLLILHQQNKNSNPFNKTIINSTIITSIGLLVLASCYTDDTTTINHLLKQKKYTHVKALTESMHGYNTLFARGIACYRLKDFNCAQNAFSQAAWQAKTKEQQAKAVFNLANTHFKLADYEQASVLFKNAQQLGISKEKTQLNKAFADELSIAVRGQILDIEKTKHRADWRASAQKEYLDGNDFELNSQLSERSSDGFYFSTQKDKLASDNYLSAKGLSNQDKQSLIAKGLHRLKNKNNQLSDSNKKSWYQSSTNRQVMGIAELFNRLMPMESGIPYFPEKPLQVDGLRSW